MSTGDAEATTIQPVSAPWTVEAEAWWFITSICHTPEPGETLPISYFPSQETELYRTSSSHDAFKGGRGSILLVHYTNSPVGPFYELAMIPGEFANPYGEQCHRVTRAYVSKLEAVVSGRDNWGLPRELADFVFAPSLEHSNATEVHVYPAISFSPVEYASTPCFTALIKRVPWLPAVPTGLTHVPNVALCQPPLESSENPAADGLVPADMWHFFDVTRSRGRGKFFRCEGLLPPREEVLHADDWHVPKSPGKKRVADGVGFPDIEPYRMGVHWTHLTITFPHAAPLATL
ncbi:hypothetical protein BD413DRAFT_605759 [Trametes elegans]|nr:hypothetical protein BD413DRAFT_605759 [Trametes elegans]